MKLVYKPFKLLFGLIASRLGKGIFTTIWSRIDKEDPPSSESQHASLGKVVGAETLRAATMAAVAAVAERAAARSFHYLTGMWPASESDKDKKDKKNKKKG